MKNVKPLILLTIPMLLFGCNANNKTPEVKKGKVTVNMQGIVKGAKEEGYDITVDFDMSYFDESAILFSDDIKMLSFAASIAAEGHKIDDFYKTMGFNNVYASYPAPTESTVGFSFAHKKIKNADLVSVAIRGFDYGAEWANNLSIGINGNHAGFDARANEVYAALKMYLDTYNYSDNPKLWITGYSRGGAIANVLASKLFTERNEIYVNEGECFVYTFESPRGLCEKYAIKYDNVFNIVNEYDIVTHIAPEEYGLYRCGTDVLINTDKNIDELIKTLDPNLELPVFTPFENMWTNELEFVEYILNNLLEETIPEEASITTREEFFTRYQETIAYVINMYMTLPEATVNKIADDFSQLGFLDIALILADEDGIYNFLKPIFDEDEIPYVDSELKAHCHTAEVLIVSQLGLLVYLMNDEVMANATRMIYMHSPETIYVLIK